jgi:hypothetical protein
MALSGMILWRALLAVRRPGKSLIEGLLRLDQKRVLLEVFSGSARKEFD